MILRTPEERFSSLPGFPFEPHYLDINGMRIHYLDEGKGEAILCLHGEPTWSYLYRKLIPVLSGEYRVIAMDFIGFGRSDKFSERETYTYQMHHDTLVEFIERLSLAGITLVVHDWGGLIGLPVAAEMSQRINRLVILNTGLPTGEEPLSEAFQQWRQFVERIPNLPIGRIIRGGLAHPELVSKEIIAAYEAPFVDITYKAGASAWPLIVPMNPTDPGAAEMRRARDELSRWKKPALVMFSDTDAIMRGGDDYFRALIPAAAAQPKIIIHEAGHYLQEEKGEEIAGHILDFIHRTPI